MSKAVKSAGVLLYRKRDETEYFLVHPGGPFWKNKDAGAWSIPKGEFTTEEPEAAARREFEEETGQKLEIPLQFIGTSRLRSGKTIYAFAGEGTADENRISSNLIKVSWPPRTGNTLLVPEVDRAAWFNFAEAGRRINPGQLALLEKCRHIAGG